MDTNPDTDCTLSVWTVLLIISVTVNVMIVLYLFISVSIATKVVSGHRLEANKPLPSGTDPDCTNKYRRCLATV